MMSACMPKGKVVDVLGAEVEKLREKKLKPFIHSSLDKFLLAWSRDTTSSREESDSDDETRTITEMRKIMGISHKKKICPKNSYFG